MLTLLDCTVIAKYLKVQDEKVVPILQLVVMLLMSSLSHRLCHSLDIPSYSLSTVQGIQYEGGQVDLITKASSLTPLEQYTLTNKTKSLVRTFYLHGKALKGPNSDNYQSRQHFNHLRKILSQSWEKQCKEDDSKYFQKTHFKSHLPHFNHIGSNNENKCLCCYIKILGLKD